VAEDNEKWITVRGRHIKIENGETVKDAIARSINKVDATKSVDKLRDKNPTGFKQKAVVIDLNADIQKRFDNATPNEQRKIVKDYIMDNLRGKYPTNDGIEVAITGTTAKKYTNKAPVSKLRVAPELARLIQQSTLSGVVDAKHKSFDKFMYYDVKFSIGNETYSGVLNIGVSNNGDAILYDLNQIK